MNIEPISSFNYENFAISLINNKLTRKPDGKTITLSKKQKCLLICLLSEINERNAIIAKIWPKEKNGSRENNFNQLVFQTRELLSKGGFPDDTIITMPKYGLCLNLNLLKPMSDINDDKVLFKDQGIFNCCMSLQF